ncbi:MAG TPA: ATP-binding protein [Cyclobacteriaceae bacterium]|nr:ATP-binding protein [Cyclobacteriaceae bacterium]
MKDVVRVNLENEMDLILAHKRAMKLCELSGLSLLIQTSLATAVSEVARCAIEYGQSATLMLGVDVEKGKKLLKAVITTTNDISSQCTEATSYAKKLVDDTEITRNGKMFQVALKQNVNFQGILTENKIQSFIDYFEAEPPISAYDELRRKNLMLQDFAEKLRESEADYRTLTDSMPTMMFSVNHRGVITYTNKWLKEYLSPIPSELNSPVWKAIIHPSDFSGFNKELQQSINQQTPFNGQYRLRENQTDSYLWHAFSIIPLKNEKQVVTRWTGLIVDIDAQKTIEQTLKDNKELHEAQEQLFHNQEELQKKVIELNRSNHELEQFAHLATHDLQEPLRKLFFYSDLLNKKYSSTLDPAAITVLKNMTSAASRMRELINDLLSYSRLQKQDVVFEHVKLNDVVAEVLRDLDIQIKEKNAVVVVEDLPEVIGNVLRLRQLFNNLVSNSLKYSKTDVAPHIQITMVEDDPNVVITVKDNGIGFEDKHKERIFGLFERLHTREKYPGTGIGLSICRKIVELHHGKIEASSVLNEYSSFQITLPLMQEDVSVSKV